MILGIQIRAARGALNWSVSDLSEKSGVPTATVVRYEATAGTRLGRKGNLQKITYALEQAGIEFIGTPDDGPGIRLRKPTAAATTQSPRTADRANTPDGQE